MSTFTIYLPPRALDPLPLNTQDGRSAPLNFVKLDPPSEVRWASVSLPRRHEDVLRRLQSPFEGGSLTGDPAGSRKRKRVSAKSLSRGPLLETVDLTRSRRESVESGVSQESGERRRSKRIARTSGGESLMPTLPQLAASASIMSLNSTTSTPSQMVGNDTLRLPTWHIPISRLTPLPSLLSAPRPVRGRTRWEEGKRLISLIVCVISVDSAVCRKRAEERAKGLPGTLWIGGWKVTAPPLGAEEPASAAVKLWDSMAQEWGDDVVRRGDVVLLENVEWREATAKDPAHISISPSPGSTGPKLAILYRILPRYLSNPYARQPRHGEEGAPEVPIVPQDLRLRPDLRLGRSDPGVRKVAEVARWFANWVEGQGPD